MKTGENVITADLEGKFSDPKKGLTLTQVRISSSGSLLHAGFCFGGIGSGGEEGRTKRWEGWKTMACPLEGRRAISLETTAAFTLGKGVPPKDTLCQV